MAVKENSLQALPFWPSADELSARGKRIVILPSRLEELDGELIAAFRPDAQELRVNAAAEGVEVELYAPEGARRGVHQEHAADWVLPMLVGFPTGLATNLLANLIQARIDAWRERGAPPPKPEVSCGLVEIQGGALKVRDIEGDAQEVRDLLVELGEVATKIGDDPAPDDGEGS